MNKRGHSLDCSGFVISGAFKLNANNDIEVKTNNIVKFNRPTEVAYAA